MGVEQGTKGFARGAPLIPAAIHWSGPTGGRFELWAVFPF